MMSNDGNWDIERYREEHESEEQWELRKAFIERWKEDYDEDRLICLARVFANIEFMGCRYPLEVMKEISMLSSEVAKSYRERKASKLQRTFVSASDAAEDRAKGVKRQGGVIVDGPQAKISNINFVPQGHTDNDQNAINTAEDSLKEEQAIVLSDSDDEQKAEKKNENSTSDSSVAVKEYLNEMMKLKCIDIRQFRESMFHTSFGRLVLLIRPWMAKLNNISASCGVCGLTHSGVYDKGCYTLTVNNTLLARATGSTKAEARSIVETMAWNRLREECVSVVVKEAYISQGGGTITTEDVSSNSNSTRNGDFGTPIESGVAMKMMKLMGWSGGGLGAEAQGIAEPIKPQLQMVRRAGLGSSLTNSQQLRKAASVLMRRYLASDCLDLDLVFSSDFSKEERAELHQVAKNCGLQSKSYGKDSERFLVVKKKLDPFSLVRAVIEKGGNTPKYQVFIPQSLQNRTR